MCTYFLNACLYRKKVSENYDWPKNKYLIKNHNIFQINHLFQLTIYSTHLFLATNSF